jgi:hypothetical protein
LLLFYLLLSVLFFFFYFFPLQGNYQLQDFARQLCVTAPDAILLLQLHHATDTTLPASPAIDASVAVPPDEDRTRPCVVFRPSPAKVSELRAWDADGRQRWAARGGPRGGCALHRSGGGVSFEFVWHAANVALDE